MASLLAAGAVEGLGKGMLANVERETEDRRLKEDKAHDMQLERMHQKFLRSQQTSSQEFTAGQAEQRRGFEKEQYDVIREDTRSDITEERAYGASLVPGAERREDFVREDKQSADLDVEAMKQFTKRMESSSYTSKDGKWEMTKIMKGEIGPLGIPVGEDTLVVREPGTPFVLVPHGLAMLPHNYTEEQEEKALAIANSKDKEMQNAKKDLLSKAGTNADDSSEFLDAYGYLPISYFRKIKKNEIGSGAAWQQFRSSFRQPAAPPPPSALPPRPGMEDTGVLAPSGSENLLRQGGQLGQLGQ